jgi:hypothetical protein
MSTPSLGALPISGHLNDDLLSEITRHTPTDSLVDTRSIRVERYVSGSLYPSDGTLELISGRRYVRFLVRPFYSFLSPDLPDWLTRHGITHTWLRLYLERALRDAVNALALVLDGATNVQVQSTRGFATIGALIRGDNWSEIHLMRKFTLALMKLMNQKVGARLGPDCDESFRFQRMPHEPSYRTEDQTYAAKYESYLISLVCTSRRRQLREISPRVDKIIRSLLKEERVRSLQKLL